MQEQIEQIIDTVLPYVTAIVSSAGFGAFIGSVLKKLLTKKIDEVSPNEEYKTIKKELSDIKREIYEMRGKIK